MDDLINSYHHGNNLDLMARLPDASVDLILTDPPYLYLKHRLDRPFDEDATFAEFKRILKPTGGLVFFGRGVSMARWICKLDALGFVFKEEVVWDKRNGTCPAHAIRRRHEQAAILGLQRFVVRKATIDYSEHDVDFARVEMDLNRISSALGNPRSLAVLKSFIADQSISFTEDIKLGVCIQPGLKRADRAVSALKTMVNGATESTIMSVNVGGIGRIHPTQKPARLLERLLAVSSDEGAVVLDPFAGSGSTAIACINTNRKYICCEIDDEYAASAQKRIFDHSPLTAKAVK